MEARATPQGEVEISVLKPGEQDRLLELYRSTLPAGERTAALYAWRTGSAASGGVRPHVAARDGAMLGAVSAVPQLLSYRGTTIRAVWQQDSVVRPELRGKGVGKALLEAAATDCDVVLAKGTSEAMYRLRIASGFRDVPRSNYMVRPLTSAAFGRGLARRTAAVLASVYSKVVGAARKRDQLEIRTANSFDSTFDDLSAILAGEPQLRPVKSAAYLTWRYATCPGQAYRILTATDTRGLRGALVTRTDPAGGAWIVDLLCPATDAAAGRALIAAACGSAIADNARILRAFATAPSVRVWLRRLGFFPVVATPRFTYRFTNPETSLEPASIPWCFFHGDGDRELY